MGKLSLNAFEDWFVPRTWNVHKYGSDELVDLVSSVHLLFSERDDHIFNAADLRNELAELLKGRYYLSIVEYANPVAYVRPEKNRISATAMASAPAMLVPAMRVFLGA